MKRLAGRPAGKQYTKKIVLSMTPETFELVQSIARASEMPVVQWIRNAINFILRNSEVKK